MDFNRGQKDFPSSVQRSIWHVVMFMASFREVLPEGFEGNEGFEDGDKVDGDKERLLRGERNLYKFFMDLYSDMYEDPEKYFIPVGEYDDFINDEESKSLATYKQKESTLRNEYQQAIQLYQHFLFDIGKNAILGNVVVENTGDYNDINNKDIDVSAEEIHNSSILSIAQDDYQNIIKSLRLSKVRGQEEKRLTALKDLGLEIDRKQDKIFISCEHYPDMLAALSLLCKSGTKKYAYTNFIRCDFRGVKSYKPSIEDVVAVIPEVYKSMVLEMDSMMESMNCRRTINPLKTRLLNQQWKVAYKKKGKSVYAFEADVDKLNSIAYFNYPENISKMGYLLKEESVSLYKWFYNCFELMECSCKNNKLVDIGGKKKRICGLSNRMDIYNPDKKEFENMKYIIELFQKNVK